MLRGVPFHGEIDSSLSTVELFLLYGAGSSTAFLLAATDQLIISDILMACATTTTTMTIFEDVDAGGTVTAGEVIAKYITSTTASTLCSLRLAVPHYCKIGVTPSLLCSGAVPHNAIIRGTVWRT